ncbi:MAG: type II toxin-antitoxin system HicB family antitoxin [Candidatus Hydrogenedentales bacterium]
MKQRREFTVIYERGETNWGAIVPDLPGCVSIGDSLSEVQQNVLEAIELYLEELDDRGEPTPEPRHSAGVVSINAN